MNTQKLYYLFDPLCGWCYGATPAVSALLKADNITLELLPSGLFAGQGARPMNAEFAGYAWSNDQRISQLSGLQFSTAYRDAVLTDYQQRFDSGPATLALTAVAMTAPERELEALKAIQQARYIKGANITALTVLTDELKELGLEAAADLLERHPLALQQANTARIIKAQQLMQKFSARGVPTFIAESAAGQKQLNSSNIYAAPDVLLQHLQLA